MVVFVPVRWLGEDALEHKYVFSIPQGYLFSGMDLVIQLGFVWGVTALLIVAFRHISNQPLAWMQAVRCQRVSHLQEMVGL